MFKSWSRSWEFAKLSYSTLLDNKHLIVFPVISTIAMILILASFLLPLGFSGSLDTWLASLDSEAVGSNDPKMYVAAFLFYFCNYFCVVFFNTALIASVMDIFEGGEGKLSFGLKFATKRIHAIFGWALVSAVIGMILNAIERNEKAGRFIAAIIGSGWTALTYFVVPVIVAEGAGPVEAVKRSFSVLKKEWGTALTGNFSMGTFGFILMLPVLLVGLLLFTTVGYNVTIIVCVPLGILAVLISATADAIFKAYLYAYATGKTLPDDVDTQGMRDAFSGM